MPVRTMTRPQRGALRGAAGKGGDGGTVCSLTQEDKRVQISKGPFCSMTLKEG